MTLWPVGLDHTHLEALGVRCQVLFDGPAGLAMVGRSRLEHLDAKWSRLRPDSELSQLNRCGGLSDISDELLALVSRAADGWEATDGAFDPTRCRAVAPTGGWDARRSRGRRRAGVRPWSHPVTTDLGITVDPIRRRVALRSDVVLGAGSLIRALAADLVVAELRRQGAWGVQVTIGETMSCWGQPPSQQVGWPAPDLPPFGRGSNPMRVALAEGGIASSSRFDRSSRPSKTQTNGHRRRSKARISDPATALTMTVVDWSAADAAIRAEAALTDSLPEAMAQLAADGCPASAVDDEQKIWTTPQWAVLQQLATPTSP